VAQGVANVACGFFQGMPGGGSLSSTALGASAGARTRWAGFFIGVVVIVFVLLFGGFLELIPMTSLGALLIYSAALSVKIPLIVAVQKTGLRSHFAMLATFALTLLMPLQQAIILGVIVAGVLYIYRSSTDIRIVRLDQVDGRFVESEAPETVPDNQVLLLDVYGSLFYAGARTLASNLPSATDAQNAVVVLRLRSQGEVGSTLLNVLNTYAGHLQKGGGLLMLTGIDPEIKARMTAANQLATIGPDNVFVATHIRHQSIDAALAAARQWQLAQAEPEKV
jgi:SulP family sulfate permease